MFGKRSALVGVDQGTPVNVLAWRRDGYETSTLSLQIQLLRYRHGLSRPQARVVAEAAYGLGGDNA